MRPYSKKIGSLFSERRTFLGKTVAFPFVRDDVEVPTDAAKKRSALLVNAPGDHRASYFTVISRGAAEMRTALIAAITLACTIGAQEQTRADTMEWNER